MIPIGVLASSRKPWAGLSSATFDATLGNSTTSDNKTTYSFNNNIGTYYTGRVILISAHTNGSDANTSCTLGGVSLPKIASVVPPDGRGTHLWYYNGTLEGTQTASITISGGANYMNAYGYRITCPYQDTPFAYVTDIDTTISATLDLIPKGSLVWFQAVNSNNNNVITPSYSGPETITTFNSGVFNNGNLYGVRARLTAASDGSGTMTTGTASSVNSALLVAFR